MTIIDDNTVVVFNEADLRTVLAGNNAYTLIYFGADIKITSGINILPSKSQVIIDGTYEGVRYTYEDPSSSGSTVNIGVRAASSINITMQNIDIIGNNWYGAICIAELSSTSDVVITYNNVTYVGPQMGFCPYASINLIDCEITIQASSSSIVNEMFEARSLTIGGNTTIVHKATGNSVIWYRVGGNANFRVLSGANVSITTSRSLYDATYSVPMVFEPNSIFILNANNGVSVDATDRASTVLVDNSASVTINRTGTAGAATLYINESLTINEGASLKIESNVGSDPLIYFYVNGATLNINNPKSVILYNSNSYLFYFTGTTNLNINGKQINQWNSAVKPGDINNLPTYSWYKDDLSVIQLAATATNSNTNITSNNLSVEELAKLPALNLLQLRTARVLAIGCIPRMNVNAITETSTNISGVTTSNAGIKVETTTETLFGEADDNGSFDVFLTNSLSEGEEIKITASNNNYFYNYKTVTVVYPGELVLYVVPEKIPFITNNPVSTSPPLFGRNEGWMIQVYDSRIDSTNWNLYATVFEPLTSNNNHILTDSLVHVTEDNSINVLGETKTLIYTGEANGGTTKITDVIWNEDKGLLLYVQNEPVYLGETYTNQYIF